VSAVGEAAAELARVCAAIDRFKAPSGSPGDDPRYQALLARQERSFVDLASAPASTIADVVAKLRWVRDAEYYGLDERTEHALIDGAIADLEKMGKG
jgi:hypothetical protein